MDYHQIYQQWVTDPFFDKTTKEELITIADEREIEERFYCNLKFGTGGMRGIMGAGTNRLNQYTIGRATKGVADYALANFSAESCAERGIAIAYDTRNNSREFAKITANVLSGMGIKVYLFDKPVPTPQLSYTIPKLNCILGIVITASHNPKEYNGYKLYDEKGGQLVPDQVKRVIQYIDKISDYTSVCFEGNNALIDSIDNTEAFVNDVIDSTPQTATENKKELKVVYTPLHGTGSIPVQRALNKVGFSGVTVISEQEMPDGNFSTVKSPNPENKESMELALDFAGKHGADIVLGTDPDCDRVGVGVRQNGEYVLLTGNQTGALLSDYVTKSMTATRPALIKTVVSSDLGAEIAKSRGVTVFTTLTGFKYAGEKISQFEQAKRENCTERAYDFVFGYEESYGYLAGTYARDKDGVGTCLLICEMAAEYKAEGKTLVDRLHELYQEYGYYLDYQDSFVFEGKAGVERMNAIMAEIRSNGIELAEPYAVLDYNREVEAEKGFGKLPRSNVLKLVMDNGSWLAIRPSGTEPKIKVYYSIKMENKELADRKLEEYRSLMKNVIRRGD